MNVCGVGTAVALAASRPPPSCRAPPSLPAAGAARLVGTTRTTTTEHADLVVPRAGRAYGHMYVGYGNGSPQGGMNEAGLFSTGRRRASGRHERQAKPGWRVPWPTRRWLSRTVEEVVQLYERYDRTNLGRGLLSWITAGRRSPSTRTAWAQTGPWSATIPASTTPEPRSAVRAQAASRPRAAGCATVEDWTSWPRPGRGETRRVLERLRSRAARDAPVLLPRFARPKTIDLTRS